MLELIVLDLIEKLKIDLSEKLKIMQFDCKMQN